MLGLLMGIILFIDVDLGVNGEVLCFGSLIVLLVMIYYLIGVDCG